MFLRAYDFQVFQVVLIQVLSTTAHKIRLLCGMKSFTNLSLSHRYTAYNEKDYFGIALEFVRNRLASGWMDELRLCFGTACNFDVLRTIHTHGDNFCSQHGSVLTRLRRTYSSSTTLHLYDNILTDCILFNFGFTVLFKTNIFTPICVQARIKHDEISVCKNVW